MAAPLVHLARPGPRPALVCGAEVHPDPERRTHKPRHVTCWPCTAGLATPAAVRGRVGEIRRVAAAGDHELAHQLEDELHRHTLAAIAASDPTAEYAVAAAAALRTRQVDFDRWHG